MSIADERSVYPDNISPGGNGNVTPSDGGSAIIGGGTFYIGIEGVV